MKAYDLKTLKDARGRKPKYPWHELDKPGAYFVWENIDDAFKLRSAARGFGLKASVRNVGGVLHIIRVG